MMCETAKRGGWCGLCYAGVRCRETYPGHFGWRAAVKKPEGLATADLSESWPEGAKKWPRIWEHLSTCRWEDGTVRQTSTLTICLEGGKLKACVNDRSMRASLWRSGDTLTGALETLEKALGQEGADWRPWKSS